MPTMYQEIVFLQGDEAHEVLDKLCHVEGVVVHGATAESTIEAAEYLMQWDDGEGPQFDYDPADWSMDTVEEFEDTKYEGQGYVMAYNVGHGYISLQRKAIV